MKSIDNLREYALTAASVNATTRAVLAGYIDGIEREVEELHDRDYRNGREDAEGAVEFADRLCRASERREDVTLWGVDYTPLPVDADGVPIHVGDVMTEHEDGYTFKVDGLMDWDGEWWVFQREGIQAPVRRCTHHHAPTVEDVLREFAAEVETAGGVMELPDAILAEYAAKLRMSGEDE